MEHAMKLLNEPFEKIVSGTKTIEIRLFDEKRQKLNVGDTIEFARLDSMDKIKVEIVALLRYDSFRDLINDVGPEQLGHPDGSVDDVLEKIYTIYSSEQEQCYGVLGIKISTI
ncbi:MAG: ASCH domain-containing protein [Nanobdellota archaeon]